ncbi:MAG: T9SS type A sorting domain-containing protein [candidate division KSB1 bacterium]|nr:T9SS type A sorting domain-containing protein [candidate division KSB1 bacterium]MDZ7302526.1 T9SS type A sorting domain-containing protein [candidate division KSB1 bacterium]
MPDTFSLSQNYPNPFNPVTTIKYSIPRSGFVSLKVFDVIGHEVANLVEGMKPAGNHVASFNGSGLSSSVYFCRLQAGSFAETRKLVLLR